MDKKTLSELENELKELKDHLFLLREKGETKINTIKGQIKKLKTNKLLNINEKKDKISKLLKDLEVAKIEKAKVKKQVINLQKKALAVSKNYYSKKILKVKEQENAKIYEYKQAKKAAFEALDKTYQKELSQGLDPQQAKLHRRSKRFEIENKTKTNISVANDEKIRAYLSEVQTNIDLRNGKTNALENLKLQFYEYIYKFKLSTFMLENGLYLAILIFFIVCIIIAPLQGSGQLLSLSNIFTVLEQASTRMFYALGVAGLILLTGTDLSIGRMVAMGSVITGLILHPGLNIVTFFGLGPWDFTNLPMSVRVLMALSLSIGTCVLFSIFAGFFTAKLKIHPFISTLSTQLVIYGLLFFGTSGTPVGSIDKNIKDILGGRWVLGTFNGELITFPKLIVPAIVAIIIAQFIWNKTTFGKNMYAVGGNAEAASVSGISVFKITMGVFFMAGVFYGIGAFLEAFRANASAGTGQGYELDAIAACVVGGISFNGGIGKIGGAVIGVIIFTSLTYCLTFLGIDTNLQFVFKGLIIMAAVALDSVKYLQKK